MLESVVSPAAESVVHVCSPDCKPGECPAIYTGPVDRDLARAIHSVTEHDSQGRLYFRRSLIEGWRRLRPADYPELNRIIDGLRNGSV